MQFRHEWKHTLELSDMLTLRARLCAVMEPDCHSANGQYTVTSLYFDNLRDKALLEKVNGVDRREKFRLRRYNDDLTYLLLEKKCKEGGLCSKMQTQLTKEQAQALCSGTPEEAHGKNPLLRELLAKMRSEGLRPKTLVSYTRQAFVFAPGGVRVTLDYDLRTGLFCTDFLQTDCVMLPPPKAPILLEVKWDAFLPSVIRDAVQLPGCRTVSFSKYAACRAYG